MTAQCPCCEGHGILPPSTSGLPGMVDGAVAQLCCDGCLSALFLGGWSHPHELIRPEPHFHWPAPGQAVQPCSEREAYVAQTCVVADHLDTALVDYAHQETHDLLIEGLGARRVSGVWWTHYEGADATAVVDELLPADDPNPRVAEVRAGTLDYLASGARPAFVVAWCMATAAEGEVIYG